MMNHRFSQGASEPPANNIPPQFTLVPMDVSPAVQMLYQIAYESAKSQAQKSRDLFVVMN